MGMTLWSPNSLSCAIAAAAVALAILGISGARSAEAATSEQEAALAATGCSGIVVAPDNRRVRRSSRVRLEGRRCMPTAASGTGPTIQVRLRKGRSWSRVATARADSLGRFSVCIPVRVSRGTRSAKVKVSSSDGATRQLKLKVSSKGARSCSPPTEIGDPNCPLTYPGTAITMTLPPACTVVASDTSLNPDPTPFWGSIECGTSPSNPIASRHQQITTGGDAMAQGTGFGQNDQSFRRLTVMDGDDFYGERCELGLNDNRTSPVALYNEGRRRATYFSIRLPESFPSS